MIIIIKPYTVTLYSIDKAPSPLWIPNTKHLWPKLVPKSLGKHHCTSPLSATSFLPSRTVLWCSLSGCKSYDNASSHSQPHPCRDRGYLLNEWSVGLVLFGSNSSDKGLDSTWSLGSFLLTFSGYWTKPQNKACKWACIWLGMLSCSWNSCYVQRLAYNWGGGGCAEKHTENSLRVLWDVALICCSELPLQICAWYDSMGVT